MLEASRVVLLNARKRRHGMPRSRRIWFTIMVGEALGAYKGDALEVPVMG
jgi:hypothetical protein